MQKESKALDKSKNKLMKPMQKSVKKLSCGGDVLTLPSAPSGSTPSELVRKSDRKSNHVASVVRAGDGVSDSNSEVEVQEKALTLKGKGNANGVKAFEQRDLIALAFAGDNEKTDYRTLSFSLLITGYMTHTV